MSDFKVEVVEIRKVHPHPNADRLEIIYIRNMGYQTISAKGNFKEGDLAFYFPVDSVIPEKFVEEFGIGNYYSKKLRAAKLRGIFSEGLLIPVNENLSVNLEDDFTEFFGVTKYEYPIPLNMQGDVEKAIPLQDKFPAPVHLKRYPKILVEGEQVVITEKVHGTNFTVLRTESETYIGSHNYFWKNSEANKNQVYVRAFNENKGLQCLSGNSQVFGEIYGVQDIKYGMKNGEIGIVIFAAKKNGRLLDYSDFVDFCCELSLPMAPFVYSGEFQFEKLNKYNNADSLLSHDCMMEGLIIQPVIERTHPGIGRVCMKLISDRYLLRKGGSELH